MAEVDIIALWNKGKGNTSLSHELNLEEISRKQSKTPLYWIKIILWIEFWINLISLPSVYFLIEIDPLLYGVIMPIIIVIYLVYYQFLIREINQFDYAEDVRTGLRKLYGYLNFFFLHYKVVIWVSLILGFVYGLTLGMDKSTLPPEAQEAPAVFWISTIGVGLLFATIIGLLLTWLINLIYGRKIKRLKGIVKELEKEEAA